MIGSILDLSPQKRLLNYEDFTPAKIMVGCDINGWFETHKKSPIIQKKKPPRFIHSRFNAQKKLKEINKFDSSPNEVNLLSITKLKGQMVALSTKCQLQALSTNCKSTTQQSTEGKKQNKIPVLNVNISSFDEIVNNFHQQKKPIKPFQHFFHIREIKTSENKKKYQGSITQRMQERKKSMNKILSCNKMKGTEKQDIQNHLTRKIFLINQSQQIIKGNLSTNQKRTLNMIVSSKNSIRIQNIPEPVNANRKISTYERYRNKPILDKFN